MKIAHFSLLSSLLLLLLASILSGSLYLGWNQHLRQSAQRQTYEQLRQAVAQEAQRQIGEYLLTGDTSRLSQARSSLQQAQRLLAQLPPELTAQSTQPLQRLHERLAGDYLAAGKLAGNSQQLLQNAESELLAT